jgi:hypothetical protein
MDEQPTATLPDLCEESTSSERQRPPLRILHLLLWMTCVAMYLGMTQVWEQQLESRLLTGRHVQTKHVGYNYNIMIRAPHAVVTGAVFGGFFVGFHLRWCGRRFPAYPGEYKIIILAARVLLFLGLSFGFLFAGRLMSPVQIFLPNLFYSILSLWAFFAVAVRNWRMYYLTCTIVSLVGIILYYAGFYLAMHRSVLIMNLVMAIEFLALGMAVLADRLAGRHYPWTHWLGVAATASFGSIWLMEVVFVAIIRR